MEGTQHSQKKTIAYYIHSAQKQELEKLSNTKQSYFKPNPSSNQPVKTGLPFLGVEGMSLK